MIVTITNGIFKIYGLILIQYYHLFIYTMPMDFMIRF